MKNFNRTLYFFFFAGILLACNKFKETPFLNKPAYLRVFNSLTYIYSPTTKDLSPPFLIFLFDPVLDNQKKITHKATIIGDYIDIRDPFTTSFPSKAGNIGLIRNKDWPGSTEYYAAPPINGFDISAWGQIPSGKHHIILLGRPQSDIPFANLPLASLNSIIADTLVDFEPGEVYTLEAVLLDEIGQKTGAYIRKESFPHETFYGDQNYFSIYNLSTAHPNPPYPSTYFFPDSLSVYLTQKKSICANAKTDGTIQFSCNFIGDPVYPNRLIGNVLASFLPKADFFSIPILPKAEYQYPDGTIKQGKDQPYTILEIVPFGSFPSGITSSSYYAIPIISSNGKPISPNIPTYGRDIPIFYTPSLSIIRTDGFQNQVYSSVTLFELINNKVFDIQLSRLSNAPVSNP